MEVIFIKNMVCDRCKMVVKDQLENFSLQVGEVNLGEVEILSGDLDAVKTPLKMELRSLGFELLDEKDEVLNEQVKTALINFINEEKIIKEQNISDYLSEKLSLDYHKLSKLFSRSNQVTIEKYFIKLKVEKAKQLIQEDKLNFSEISYALGYSNLSHFSSQFKKEVGINLSEFKSRHVFNRKSLDKIL
ncbi:helix-turn-helix domain-containing protein [Abyssalbus ytuae]|uniref:AraC family transcriptional regulator n=1 Tax=Abyssalbus ytuae TaxID=2926907 RepID=A0A9E6ZXJ1_9FLAO|nr:AraC family transcriptional regulator [Abyssalbus ytuae]UOB18706.1 AraC family transcriptional regulator [Abyssalbus ytuae]